MKIIVGCDLKEFKKYYRTLHDLHDFYKTVGLSDVKVGELGVDEEYWVRKDPSYLIMWKEDDEAVGHAIWHETSTDKHKKGDPRDEEDKGILRRLIGRRKDNIVELHELWLKKQHRGKGLGKEFFEFFERFIRNRGYDSIVYYTDNPAAIAICRKRGYREEYLAEENWHVFCLSF